MLLAVILVLVLIAFAALGAWFLLRVLSGRRR
jgi:hypothetical protein